MNKSHSGELDANLKETIRKIRLIALGFGCVFTDNMVYVMQNGSETVCYNRKDVIGLQKLKKPEYRDGHYLNRIQLGGVSPRTEVENPVFPKL